ncbi:TPA: hypothetical protein DCE37_14450 [Candidatus Latescibacteria bacterium]|nr:hypothetical protein [Candidatus Latescibacterota bacterium]
MASLRELSALTSVSGVVSIRDNLTLESLIGLDGLTVLSGSVLIENNASLTTMTGLQNVGTVGQIVSIRDNESLESLEGLERLATAQGLVINGNASLLPNEANILLDQMVARGFQGLTNIAENNVSADLTIVDGNFVIRTQADIERLRSLGGDRFMVDGSLVIVESDLQDMEPLLTLVEVTGSLQIDRNPGLASLDGLFGLRTVGGNLEVTGNTALQSLFGINRVRTVKEHLVIFRNRRLRSLNSVRRMQVIGEGIDIRENEILPESDIIAFRDTMRARGFTGTFTHFNNGS